MKISTRTLMKALRMYGIADDNASVKSLRNVEIDDQESFLRASLTFDNVRYMILYGLSIDEDHVDELWPHKPVEATAIENPLDHTNFTTPFHGKYLMVFRLKPVLQRLDVHLSTVFDATISRSMWQKYIKAGCVLVNGQVVTSAKTEINDTDQITVVFAHNSGESQGFSVLYEDEDVIAINKPSGILTHAKGGIVDEYTVADFFSEHARSITKTDRTGVVHRLDRDTSGVIVGGRTDEAVKHLQEQFATRRAKKTYIAVVDGVPKLHEARIDLPIGRNPAKPSTFRVDANGKSAQTTYRVLATHAGRSLVRLEPKTGRTHQLRVHMAHIGTPIIGDRVYGRPGDRLMLHAYELSFQLPSGADKTITATVPDELIGDFADATL